MTLWGGRFSSGMDPKAWALNASIQVDQRMAEQDVRASLAWANALEKTGLLTSEEHQQICDGLQSLLGEFQRGEFHFAERDEDIHTAVERRLGELIGPLAGKLHTGRSRNDQVATDLRLWMIERLPELDAAIAALQITLIDRAELDFDVLMPGYTHLQRAQPILLSHWWLSHFWPLQRDRGRLSDLLKRVHVLPLGSGAVAGVPYPVDRAALASELKFSQPSPNSIDAVSDRDFVAEFLFCAALVGTHLSKLGEQVIIFSSGEVGFFELSDAYSTGSSLMPQKKNPDVFELARAKTGTLLGLLTGLLATLKALPSAYDKDLQEDKSAVFNAYDTLTALLPVITGALRTLAVRPERMLSSIDASMMATDLADYLVRRGVPFREAHSLVGKAVQMAVEQGKPLDELTIDDYQALSDSFGPGLYAVFEPRQSVIRRNAVGGTAPEAVKNQIQEAKGSMMNL